MGGKPRRAAVPAPEIPELSARLEAAERRWEESPAARDDLEALAGDRISAAIRVQALALLAITAARGSAAGFRALEREGLGKVKAYRLSDRR